MFRRFAAYLALATAFAAPATAQVPDTIAEAQILEGWRGEDGRHRAAVKITLAPGWKTYWRSPGAAGIPPRFDWAESGNLGRIALSYPVPNVFELAGMRSIGYTGDVVFPIIVEPATAGQPVALSGRLLIGVCEEVCVPLELTVSGTLPAGRVAPDPVVASAIADRPMSASEARVGDVACTFEPISDGLRLRARIDVDAMGPEEITVVEYADRTIWVSEPDVRRDGRTLSAVVDMVPMDGQPFAFVRDQARFTIFGGGRAVDIRGCG